jgi:hypothetical protein
MSWVPTRGGFEVGVDGHEERVLFFYGVDLVEEVVHVGRAGDGPVGDAGGGDQVVHGPRPGHSAGVAGERAVATDRQDADYPPDVVGDERGAGGTGELDIGGLDARGVRVVGR